MKKYRLLKDIPGTNKGSEVKYESKHGVFMMETSTGTTCISIDGIIKSGQSLNDWFEEIKEEPEKKWTDQDMRDFTRWYELNGRFEGVLKSFESWKEQQEN